MSDGRGGSHDVSSFVASSRVLTDLGHGWTCEFVDGSAVSGKYGVSGILIWWHSFLLLTQLISFSPETTRTFVLVCWVLASLGSGNRQGMVGIFAMTIDHSHSWVKISLCPTDPEANSGHLMPLKAYLELARRGASYLEKSPNHKLYRIIKQLNIIKRTQITMHGSHQK